MLGILNLSHNCRANIPWYSKYFFSLNRSEKQSTERAECLPYCTIEKSSSKFSCRLEGLFWCSCAYICRFRSGKAKAEGNAALVFWIGFCNMMISMIRQHLEKTTGMPNGTDPCLRGVSFNAALCGPGPSICPEDVKPSRTLRERRKRCRRNQAAGTTLWIRKLVPLHYFLDGVCLCLSSLHYGSETKGPPEETRFSVAPVLEETLRTGPNTQGPQWISKSPLLLFVRGFTSPG